MSNAILYDTAIYIDNFRSAPALEKYQLSNHQNKLRFSSVVFSELLRGCHTSKDRSEVLDMIDDVRSSTVTPTSLHWIQTGKLLSCLIEGKKLSKHQLQSLQNDILIGFCAAHVGATLVTKDRDFKALEKILGIRCVYWD